jgi:hypothetical protein
MHRRLTVTALALGVMLAAVPSVRADRQFSNADLRGPYGWSLEGTFQTISLNAIRQFTADGEGHFSGEGTVNDGRGGLKHTFACTYSVKPNGTGIATCTVQFLGQENFAFVLTDEGRAAHFISTTPGAVIHGIASRQSSRGNHDDE